MNSMQRMGQCQGTAWRAMGRKSNYIYIVLFPHPHHSVLPPPQTVSFTGFLTKPLWSQKKNINILSKTILGFINGGFLLYLTENQVYLTLLHASLHCDFPPQNLWLLSHWLVVWTSFSVHTPSSVSQRAGCVTRSPTVLISLMKSIVPLLYPELFLLRSFVLLVIFSVQIITASRP